MLSKHSKEKILLTSLAVCLVTFVSLAHTPLI